MSVHAKLDKSTIWEANTFWVGNMQCKIQRIHRDYTSGVATHHNKQKIHTSITEEKEEYKTTIVYISL